MLLDFTKNNFFAFSLDFRDWIETEYPVASEYFHHTSKKYFSYFSDDTRAKIMAAVDAESFLDNKKKSQ